MCFGVKAPYLSGVLRVIYDDKYKKHHLRLVEEMKQINTLINYMEKHKQHQQIERSHNVLSIGVAYKFTSLVFCYLDWNYFAVIKLKTKHTSLYFPNSQ